MAEATQETAAAPIVESSALRASPLYALVLLMLTYAMCHVDRNVFTILLEPIKAELHLSDNTLGFLVGFSFAALYAILGVPIAVLADRSNRRNIIAVSLLAFSAFTFVCGAVTNVVQLGLARVGVGIGEAGTSPASHAMIADLFPAEKRARAMGFYALGVNLGIMVAFLFGGWIGQIYGWRVAFFAAAVPGLALAALVRFTIQEPRRGHADNDVRPFATPKVLQSFRHLWSIPSYRHLTIGTALAVFAWYGVQVWAPSLLSRSFHMTRGQVGTALAFILGIAGGMGTFGAGVVCDWLGRKDVRWNMWVLAIIQLCTFPFCLGFYLAPNAWFGLAMFVVPAIFGVSYIASTLAMSQALAPVRMRAVASALYLLACNFLGQGFGPWAVGALSDLYHPYKGRESLRWALMTVAAVWLWSAVHFLLAARTLPADLRAARAYNDNHAADAG